MRKVVPGGLRQLTRRDLLVSFLGLPLAASACSRFSSGPPRLPPGELVGASVGLGHRLRDGFRPKPSPDAWEEIPILIVGGGVAGLAAGWRLSRSGFDRYRLLELEPEIGGTSRSGESPVVAYPWGAHYVPAPTKANRTLVEVLSEMSVFDGAEEDGTPVVAEQFLCRDPEERTYFKGEWYEGLYLRSGATGEDLQQFERFYERVRFWAGWRDGKGRRAFAIPVANCSDDAEVTSLDRVTMAEWLSSEGLTSPRLHWYVDYACRDDYGATLAQTSAWAGLFYYCSRLEGSESDESQPLITWPAGNGHLVAHLRERSMSRIDTGVAATAIRFQESSDVVEVVAYDAANDRVFGIRSKRVIFAAQRFLSGRLIDGYADAMGGHLDAFTYGSWMVANLHLSDRPKDRIGSFPLCWDNVLYESPSLGYVVATHQTELDRGPTVFTYYYPITEADVRTGRERLLANGRDEWAEICLSDLEVAHPEIRELTERLDVMRWGHAMIRPDPGFVWGESRRKALEPFRGVHFAHTDLSGVPLFEEALYHGVRAAEEVLGAFGEPVESLLT